MTNEPKKTLNVWETVAQSRRVVDFPFVDEKGRRIGARVTFFDEVAREPNEKEIAEIEARGWCLHSTSAPIGATQFVCVTGATRDGQNYGAFGRKAHTEHKTPAARDAHARRYLAEAAARAGKVRGARPAPVE